MSVFQNNLRILIPNLKSNLLHHLRNYKKFACDWETDKECCNNYHGLLIHSKTDYYKDQLSHCTPRELFAKVKQISHWPTRQVLPPGSDHDVANNFMENEPDEPEQDDEI